MTTPEPTPPSRLPAAWRDVEGPRGLTAIGSASLAIEAVILLLALAGTATLQRGHLSAVSLSLLGVLVVATVVVAGMLRRRSGRVAASVLQLLVIVAGLITWPLYLIGLVFGGLWVYWLRQWEAGGSPTL